MSSEGLTIKLKFILEKGRDFDYVQEWYEDTKDLAEFFGRRFNDVKEIEEKILGGKYYIPGQIQLNFQGIPFTVRKWPVYYHVQNPSCTCRLEIATIEAIIE